MLSGATTTQCCRGDCNTCLQQNCEFPAIPSFGSITLLVSVHGPVPG